MTRIATDELEAGRPAVQAVPVGWCQPMRNGEPTPRQFIVWFDDADRGPATFDDEAEARAFWTRANDNWNCYLFGALPLEPAAPAAAAMYVSAEQFNNRATFTSKYMPFRLEPEGKFQTPLYAALSQAEPADAATSLIIEHIEKYDTPNDHDTRRRYTLAQVETAIRLAAKAEPAAVAGLAARLMKEADNMQYNDDLDSMDDGIKLMREAAAAIVALSPAPAALAGLEEDERERILETVVAPDNGSVSEVLDAVLTCSLAWQPEARIIGNVRAGDIARAVSTIMSQQAALAGQEGVAWEATTLVYKQFITDEQYQKFSPEVQNWYKPYRCSACGSPAPAGVQIKALTEITKAIANVELRTPEEVFDIMVARIKSALIAPPAAAWCQPMHNGEHTPRKFIVRFEDAERGDAVFDDEAEARAFWTKANDNWNCYLFGSLPLDPIAPPAAGVQATWGDSGPIPGQHFGDEFDPAPAAGVQAVPELLKLVRWAHDTLLEINPSNYDHDDVCRLNDASVEVILGLAPVLGETHGKSAEWWSARAAAPAAPVGEER